MDRAADPVGFLARLLEAPFAFGVRVFESLMSRRGLYLWFLLLVAVRIRGGWLRPALDRDFNSFQLPLFGGTQGGWGYGMADPGGGALVSQQWHTAVIPGAGDFVWLSPGVVMVALIAIGAVVALARPERFAVAAGLLLCGVLMSIASVAFNHPDLIARLDQQHQQREQLISVLQATAHPPVEIIAVGRIKAPFAPAEERGSLLRGLIHLRYGGSLLLLSAAGLLLSMRGPLSGRLGRVGLWSLGGVVLAAGVSFNRLTAEWHWQRAVVADGRGALDEAEQHAIASLERCPELGRLERTWIFLGKLDYRRGTNVETAKRQNVETLPPQTATGSGPHSGPYAGALSYFRAYQLSRNGELRRGIALLEELARLDQPGVAHVFRHGGMIRRVPHSSPPAKGGGRNRLLRESLFAPVPHYSPTRRLLADLVAQLALTEFQQGRLQAAEDLWQRAFELDRTQAFRPLFVAALRARTEQSDPDAVAAIVDPLLDRMADRALRGALLAMLGDGYFQAGRFAEARGRYHAAIAAYSLPKQINYRALRGLTGL